MPFCGYSFGVSLREVLAPGPGFNPASILLVKDLDRFIRNHFTRAAHGTVDGPHSAGPYGFADKFDLQARVTSLAYAWEQDVAFQLDLPVLYSKRIDKRF